MRAMDLTAAEVRVLGCLLEKQRTTPDAYPLTLNSLRLACNQSTNREPVVDYSEAQVRDALQRLERRGLVRFASGAGSRAAKFRHLLAEKLPMDDAEQALMCVLMLRGPQTPGELKQRGDRLHAFAGLAEVNDTLQRLIGRDLARRLGRRPGQKEERYAQLLSAEAEAAHAGDPEQRAPGVAPSMEAPVDRQPPSRSEAMAAPLQAIAERAEELADLRARVARLEAELRSLKEKLGAGVSA